MNADRIIKSAEDGARNLYRDDNEREARLANEIGQLRAHVRGLCASLKIYRDPFVPDPGEWVAQLFWGDVPVPCLVDEDGFISMCGINGNAVDFSDMPDDAQRCLNDLLDALTLKDHEAGQSAAYDERRAA